MYPIAHQVNALKDQTMYLASELTNARQECETASRAKEQLAGALELLRGSTQALAPLSVEQLEQLEQQLRSSLEIVETRKVSSSQAKPSQGKPRQTTAGCW